MDKLQVWEIESFRPAHGGSPRFEGGQWGIDVSSFIIKSPKGKGAGKHRHPYPELFFLLEGEVEAFVDDEKVVMRGGQMWMVAPDTWHGFTVLSDEPIRMISIHPAGTMVQEDA